MLTCLNFNYKLFYNNRWLIKEPNLNQNKNKVSKCYQPWLEKNDIMWHFVDYVFQKIRTPFFTWKDMQKLCHISTKMPALISFPSINLINKTLIN